MSAENLRDRAFGKILLIKLSALGDIVQSIPLLNKLRRRYPAAQLDWLVTPSYAELLQRHPAITGLVEFPRDEWSAPWRAAPFARSFHLAAQIRGTGYDLVIDLQGQLRSGLVTYATGAPVRIGFDRPRAQIWESAKHPITAEARKHAWHGAREGSWLAYTHRVPVPNIDVHAVDRYLSLGPLLGLDDGPADFSFPIPAEANVRIEALLDYYDIAKSRLIVMAPGTIWETKQWLAPRFAEAARHFQQKGFAVALIGSGRERALCAEVATLAPGAVNLAGETTLSELAALIRRSDICLSNNSGPMHLAVAVNRPVVSIFGPTDPVWIGPYRREGAVLHAKIACAPCYLRQLSRCPNSHACMHEISAGAVIERMEALIGQKPAGQSTAKLHPGRNSH